jgi:hypothetical protein
MVERKLRCISNSIGAIPYEITVGNEYVALGLSHASGKSAAGLVHFWIKDDRGNYLVPTPANLFEVVDPSVSCYWVVKIDGERLFLSATEFLAPFFLDDLSNQDEEPVRIFRRISALIEDEARSIRN